MCLVVFVVRCPNNGKRCPYMFQICVIWCYMVLYGVTYFRWLCYIVFYCVLLCLILFYDLILRLIVLYCVMLCYIMFNPHKVWAKHRFHMRFERIEVRMNLGLERTKPGWIDSLFQMSAKWTSRTVEFHSVRPPEVRANLRLEPTWGSSEPEVSSELEVRANQAGTGRAYCVWLCSMLVWYVTWCYIVLYHVILFLYCVILCLWCSTHTGF